MINYKKIILNVFIYANINNHKNIKNRNDKYRP